MAGVPDLFQLFRDEGRQRLNRVKVLMAEGSELRVPAEVYHDIFQELDSLYGAARATDMAEWEQFYDTTRSLAARMRKQLHGVDTKQHRLMQQCIRYAIGRFESSDESCRQPGDEMQLLVNELRRILNLV